MNDNGSGSSDNEIFYLLVGEKQGVSAAEPAEMDEIEEGRIILAETAADLQDERVSVLPLKFTSNLPQ